MYNDHVKQSIISQASACKAASRKLALLPTKVKNDILAAMAQAIISEKKEIIFKNEIDVAAAKDAGLSSALIDRLTLNEKRVIEMGAGLRQIAELSDPVGEIITEWTAPSGLHIEKVRVPLGVVGFIYESRPNVTVDAAGLCLKSGNAVLLRGGSEAINSNHTLVKILVKAGLAAGLPEGALQFIETTDREAVLDMIKLDRIIDLIIPRGSEEMINFVRQHATVPILAHGKGLCHTYIDRTADIKMAQDIALNAKCQRPGVCNAMETLLIHKDIADKLLQPLAEKFKNAGVEMRGDEASRKLSSDIIEATEADWSTEYLGLILSIKIVNSLDEAIDHINRHGSGHSEAIITEDALSASRFMKEVDASAVFHNASTRLHDGSVFGFGSEIGISTQKLHARGTMGLKELTSTKYLAWGHGEIRQ